MGFFFLAHNYAWALKWILCFVDNKIVPNKEWPEACKAASFIQRKNKNLRFDQVWSCYIRESFKGRTVLMKLMFSYLLWAIFYYRNFILNKYHYFRYFSRSLYKMSELLCVMFMPCVWLFILFQVCIFHDTILKKSCFPKRLISHVKEVVVYHLFLLAL